MRRGGGAGADINLQQKKRQNQGRCSVCSSLHQTLPDIALPVMGMEIFLDDLFPMLDY